MGAWWNLACCDCVFDQSPGGSNVICHCSDGHGTQLLQERWDILNTNTIGGITLVLVAIYLFVANAEGANKVIGSLAKGYAQAVTALQGRGTSEFYA